MNYMDRDKFLLLNLELALRAAELRGIVSVHASLDHSHAIQAQLTDRGRAALSALNKDE